MTENNHIYVELSETHKRKFFFIMDKESKTAKELMGDIIQSYLVSEAERLYAKWDKESKIKDCWGELGLID